MTTAVLEAKQQRGAAQPGGVPPALAAVPGGGGATATTSAGLLPPLEAQLAASRASFLHPQAFFVSWQGVLTLAYSGFTGALLDLKQRVTAAHPTLPPENPGSKWPKTSIGCLRDGRRLTPEQLATLCRICSEESAAFQQQQPQQQHGAANGAAAAAAAAPAAAAAGSPAVAVDSACIALFECRSLERLLSCRHVEFQGGLDAASPSEEEQQRVAAILAEPSSPTYWFEASRDGNREAHYRGPHLGATLMHPLLLPAGPSAAAPGDAAAAAGSSAAAAGVGGAVGGKGGTADRRALVAAIERFRRRVDAELPGLYVWFSDASLHITLRALIN
ncbi:hypothetical protein C2E21_6681 [Chlorella sorokiniana]|uniref:Uncharacterized protein n=1 Tax=Chlorella sorokiniana TaxID=3076 RepID=A0A2P6TKH4_CHLSO|nr:hypothetical protein C2E21_6681 [Chlorella sorokiniana]|eukprot:PRW44592.1 hypothetical protein C2E21_6681 [Chlorella sorokiniana]